MTSLPETKILGEEGEVKSSTKVDVHRPNSPNSHRLKIHVVFKRGKSLSDCYNL